MTPKPRHAGLNSFKLFNEVVDLAAVRAADFAAVYLVVAAEEAPVVEPEVAHRSVAVDREAAVDRLVLVGDRWQCF